MSDLQRLLNTVPGQVALGVFATKAGTSECEMRAEILRNAPLAAYFVKIVREAMAEVPA